MGALGSVFEGRGPKRAGVLRSIAALATLAMVAVTFVMVEGEASAAGGTFPISLTCEGISTDPGASSLGTSKQTLGALGGPLAIGGEVTSNIPSKVRPGTGPFDATFAIKVVLPASITDQARNLLKVDAVGITGAKFSVNYAGGANGTIEQAVPDSTVSLAANPVTVVYTIAGKVDPSGSGLISFTPGGATFGIAINKSASIAGATITINTLTVNCRSTGEVGSTNIQVPGAPNVEPGLISKVGAPNQLVNLDVGLNITPDDNNPIIPGSLRIVSQSSGGAALNGNFVSYRYPLLYPANGLANSVNLEVCGASRIQKGRPGVNEVQTMAWNEDWSTDFNSKPIAFSLKVGDQETELMSTSYANDLFGNPVATPIRPEDDLLLLNRNNSRFSPPSAATVRSALEKLPNVGAGNVNVTETKNAKGWPTGYSFEFVGAKAAQPIATKIGIGKWYTWLPADIYATVQGAISGGGPGATTTTVPGTPAAEPTRTVPELQADLAAGKITIEQFFDKLPTAILPTLLSSLDLPAIVRELPRIFPQPPAFETATSGAVVIPDAPTGPLCTGFQVQFKQDAFLSFVVGVVLSQIAELQKTQVAGISKSRACSGKTVRVRTTYKKYYTKNGKRYYRYVKGYKYVCKK